MKNRMSITHRYIIILYTHFLMCTHTHNIIYTNAHMHMYAPTHRHTFTHAHDKVHSTILNNTETVTGKVGGFNTHLQRVEDNKHNSHNILSGSHSEQPYHPSESHQRHQDQSSLGQLPTEEEV